jgi:pimeloyl-ACP methyl ester carboxylesterase
MEKKSPQWSRRQNFIWRSWGALLFAGSYARHPSRVARMCLFGVFESVGVSCGMDGQQGFQEGFEALEIEGVCAV